MHTVLQINFEIWFKSKYYPCLFKTSIKGILIFKPEISQETKETEVTYRSILLHR